MKSLRIGTRRSSLAVAQSNLVADEIRLHHPGIEVELVKIVTTGDRATGPLAAEGGKGLFTAQLELALRDGSIDLAVHSAKDVPIALEMDFAIAAVPERADARDALVSRYGVDLSLLCAGARVGTGSLRRRAQLLYLRDDLEIVPVRGNVETRLRKAIQDSDEALDAVVLAMAGLIRSGLADEHADWIRPLDDVIPAAGQGALAIETLVDNDQVAQVLAPLNHPPSHEALLAERAMLADLKADCHSCLAAYIAQVQGQWRASAMVARADGTDMVQFEECGKSAEEAGVNVAAAMRAGGAMELLHG